MQRKGNQILHTQGILFSGESVNIISWFQAGKGDGSPAGQETQKKQLYTDQVF